MHVVRCEGPVADKTAKFFEIVRHNFLKHDSRIVRRTEYKELFTRKKSDISSIGYMLLLNTPARFGSIASAFTPIGLLTHIETL